MHGFTTVLLAAAVLLSGADARQNRHGRRTDRHNHGDALVARAVFQPSSKSNSTAPDSASSSIKVAVAVTSSPAPASTAPASTKAASSSAAPPPPSSSSAAPAVKSSSSAPASSAVASSSSAAPPSSKVSSSAAGSAQSPSAAVNHQFNPHVLSSMTCGRCGTAYDSSPPGDTYRATTSTCTYPGDSSSRNPVTAYCIITNAQGLTKDVSARAAQMCNAS
ncbi:hypothetical protein EMMF5_003401 [Cystobasidiomycetes sp. EMM_F5]